MNKHPNFKGRLQNSSLPKNHYLMQRKADAATLSAKGGVCAVGTIDDLVDQWTTFPKSYVFSEISINLVVVDQGRSPRIISSQDSTKRLLRATSEVCSVGFFTN